MGPKHVLEGSVQLTYCFCDFHPSCGPVQLLEIGGVGYVTCNTCHVLGHIDLVGHRVSIATCKEKVHE